MPYKPGKSRFVLNFKRRLARFKARRLIQKLDPNQILKARQEIRLFMVVRNESLRLPFLLEYYFSQGVDRIFVLDNGSTDGTPEIVLSKKNTHLFHALGPYMRHGEWIDTLLHRYGLGHWCLVVDGDEQLIYPHFEKIKIRQLCEVLSRKRLRCHAFFTFGYVSERAA